MANGIVPIEESHERKDPATWWRGRERPPSSRKNEKEDGKGSGLETSTGNQGVVATYGVKGSVTPPSASEYCTASDRSALAPNGAIQGKVHSLLFCLYKNIDLNLYLNFNKSN